MIYQSDWLGSQSRPDGNIVELDLSSAPPIRLERFTYTVEIEKNGAEIAEEMVLGIPDIGDPQTPGWEKSSGTWQRLDWVGNWKLSAQIVVSRD